jgi:hypothetical protein
MFTEKLPDLNRIKMKVRHESVLMEKVEAESR